MLSDGCLGSIQRRFSSVGEASSFFEKVQLHFEPSDLLKELVFLDIGVLLRLARRENLRQMIGGMLLPEGHQIRINAERLRDLRRCLIPFYGFNRDLRLQARRVAPASSWR